MIGTPPSDRRLRRAASATLLGTILLGSLVLASSTGQATPTSATPTPGSVAKPAVAATPWQPPRTIALAPPRIDLCAQLKPVAQKKKRGKRKAATRVQALVPPPWPGLDAATLARRQQFWPQVLRTACALDVPPLLLDALIVQESRYNPQALSRVGAAGLTQLMPITAFELGILNPLEPQQNLHGGARYLRRMLDRFDSPELALAAYNAGPTKVGRLGGIPDYAETRTYVGRVIETWRRLDPEPVHLPVPRLDDSLPDPDRLAALRRPRSPLNILLSSDMVLPVSMLSSPLALEQAGDALP